MEACADEFIMEGAEESEAQDASRAWDFVFPRVQGKRGNQLIMVKNAPSRPPMAASQVSSSSSCSLLEDVAWIPEREREQLALFRRDSEMHQARLDGKGG